ncbi:hypothetical protein SKAU_G00082990 [Synaphobranchus kaupii]|uniref:Uncharacterized protein n=1 Tax=Synaphobranchus kaupii TaxID=118154 RepID=A0A9Q1FW31_SYNKA|nr:hypothetical protein SKAU_G00082990 [Synaphobranchus kaupii]
MTGRTRRWGDTPSSRKPPTNDTSVSSFESGSRVRRSLSLWWKHFIVGPTWATAYRVRGLPDILLFGFLDCPCSRTR